MQGITKKPGGKSCGTGSWKYRKSTEKEDVQGGSATMPSQYIEARLEEHSNEKYACKSLRLKDSMEMFKIKM